VSQPVPDYFQALMGLRAWSQVRLELHAFARGGFIWLPGTNEAVCNRTTRVACEHCGKETVSHPCPDRFCGCGFYSFKKPHQLLEQTVPTFGKVNPWVVYGVIKFWGRCIEHRSGWRAQFASVALLCTTDKALCERYGAEQFAGTFQEFCQEVVGDV